MMYCRWHHMSSGTQPGNISQGIYISILRVVTNFQSFITVLDLFIGELKPSLPTNESVYRPTQYARPNQQHTPTINFAQVLSVASPEIRVFQEMQVIFQNSAFAIQRCHFPQCLLLHISLCHVCHFSKSTGCK